MPGSVEVCVHERTTRIAVGSRARVDQHVDQLELHATLSRDPGPGYQRQRIIELLLKTRRALAPGSVDDRTGHGGDVPG